MTHHTTHFFFIGSKTGGGVQSEEAFLMLKQLKAVQIKGFTRYLHGKRFSASTVSFYFISSSLCLSSLIHLSDLQCASEYTRGFRLDGHEV